MACLLFLHEIPETVLVFVSLRALDLSTFTRITCRHLQLLDFSVAETNELNQHQQIPVDFRIVNRILLLYLRARAPRNNATDGR